MSSVDLRRLLLRNRSGHPEAEREERQAALMDIVKGPDFPTGALIVGRKGIDDAYRTGRGSITMRALVTVDEAARGRQI
jgi:DNA gyrase subunit A